MQPIDFEGELDKIIAKDKRFDREAYVFMRQGLTYCQKTILKAPRRVEGAPESHVTVAQLLDGIRLYALEEFGPMAKTVLNAWGVESCEHFGEIVFNMVECRLLSVTENDTREEFMKGYDFDTAFCAPFKPGKARSIKPNNPAAAPSAS